jgi:hypothetical protein
MHKTDCNDFSVGYPYPGGDPDPGYNPLRATSMKDKLIAAKIKVVSIQTPHPILR